MLSSWDGKNCVFSFWDERPEPIFSYVEVDDSNKIIQIKEKDKISNLANCGAYGFGSLQKLREFCGQVIEQNIRDKNEFYTSTVIRQMMEAGQEFHMRRVPNRNYYSLGTPELVREFGHGFLLDLDGTLVNSDPVYVEVWSKVLKAYKLSCDADFFKHFIMGKSDLRFLKFLMPEVTPEEMQEISNLKDRLFTECVSETDPDDVLIPGIRQFFQRIKNSRIAVVTSSNGASASAILTRTGLMDYVNLLISADDVSQHKPNPEPYIKAMNELGLEPRQCSIFEDSLTGYTAATHSFPGQICVFAPKPVDFEVEQGVVFEDYDALDYAVAAGLVEDPSTPRGRSEIDVYSDCVRKCVSQLRGPVKAVTANVTDRLKTGYICDISSLTLTYYNKKTEKVVLKLSNLGNELAKVAQELDMYTNEAYFYGQLSHLLGQDVNLPKYFGQFEHGGKIGMVLGDLREQPGTFDRDLNKDISMLLKVVEVVHNMHSAYTFASSSDLIPPMANLRKINQVTYYAQLVSERFDKFMANNRRFLDEHQALILTLIRDNYQKSEYPLSFCHGDMKSPNLFYPAKAGTDPYILDWQYIHLNKGVSDIVFLLVESINYDERRVQTVVDFHFMLCQQENPVLTYEEYMVDFRCALCIFPFFVMVWFNSEDADKLLDKAFPIRFMKKLLQYYGKYLNAMFFAQL
eukprot:TRINITY_DN2720_c0_g1_i4.p1 TRINITY_DN2720_c0_g1~~TRINITY_DN2720_c0_g1_i4.p1  ORF type:complete len:687 (+),score=178.71 TRINITY_DN2720_c0_g1_i4:524-2584(+)